MRLFRSKSLIAITALVIGGSFVGCSALSDAVPDGVSEAGDRASQAAASRDRGGEESGQEGIPREREAVPSPTSVVDEVDESDPNDPVSIGLGEDADISRRFRNRPDRCKYGRNWNAEIVGEEDSGGSAAISGGSETNPNEVFQSIFNDSMGETPTARQYLIRVMCGIQIYGIDNWVDEPPVFTNYTYHSTPHVWLSRFLVDEGAESEELETLYSAVVAHSCWAHSKWDADRGYLPYLYCSRIAGEIPSTEEVAQAFDSYYPGHAYERQNILHMTELAHGAREEVSAAFARAEEQEPELHQRLYQGMFDAMAEREEKRRQLAAIYAKVDPITEVLVDSVDNRAPAGCVDTLLEARNELANELFGGAPSNVEEVRELTARHALGYQITEALAFCYLATGQTAQAEMYHAMLDQGSRRVTEEEVAFLAVYGAINEIKQEEGRDDVLGGFVPVEIHHVYHLVRPATMGVAQSMGYEIPANDWFRTVGDTAEQPAVVAELNPQDEGVEVVFKEFSETIHYRERECFETDRIVRYDQRGDSIYPVYERQCHPVGDVKTRTVTYQAPSVVLPKAEADRVEVGQQIRVRYNRVTDDVDAVVLHMFEPGEERESGTIIEGVDVAP